MIVLISTFQDETNCETRIELISSFQDLRHIAKWDLLTSMFQGKGLCRLCCALGKG